MMLWQRRLSVRFVRSEGRQGKMKCWRGNALPVVEERHALGSVERVAHTGDQVELGSAYANRL